MWRSGHLLGILWHLRYIYVNAIEHKKYIYTSGRGYVCSQRCWHTRHQCTQLKSTISCSCDSSPCLDNTATSILFRKTTDPLFLRFVATLRSNNKYCVNKFTSTTGTSCDKQPSSNKTRLFRKSSNPCFYDLLYQDVIPPHCVVIINVLQINLRSSHKHNKHLLR